jgi:cytidylate kinase
MVIAIDGPVASGKTSVGRSLARQLGYRFLDTGIMYRALTWLALEQGINVEDDRALGRLASEAVIRLKDQDDDTVVIDGQEVSDELRQRRVDTAVSQVAKVPDVRSALVKQQREIARGGRIVAVGRDIGTVVLPDADFKLYLVASVGERAGRRHRELTQQGHKVGRDQVLGDLEARDELDTGRAHSPLRPAGDALVLDTDGMALEHVVQRALEHVRES